MIVDLVAVSISYVYYHCKLTIIDEITNEFQCIDEILSTVYSLQSRSGNIFDKFKSSILNKQNIFRSKRAVDVTRSNTDSLQPLEFYLEKTTGMTKALIEVIS